MFFVLGREVCNKMRINDKYLFRTVQDNTMVCKAINDLQLSGTSKYIGLYEEKLAAFFKSVHCVAVSSGTAALHCALYAAGVERGDEVLVPPTAPLMTALPIILIGANPVFVDTNEFDFGFDENDLRNKISPRTKAAICVPMWGYPFKYDTLKEICKNNDIVLIEDAAQAHGAKVDGEYVGTIGDIGCFSTHDRKLLSTGEGGFILTKNIEFFRRIKAFIQFNYMDGKQFGLNYKLGTMQAAIGISGLERLNKQLSIRYENAQYLLSRINNESIKTIEATFRLEPNYYALVLRFVNSDSHYHSMIREYFIESGIPSETVRYDYKCLYEYDLFSKWKSFCPNADVLTLSLQTLPTHMGLTKDNLDYMIERLQQIPNSY